MKTRKLRFLLLFITALIYSAQGNEQTPTEEHGGGTIRSTPESKSPTDIQLEKALDDPITNKRRYLSKFSQSWKLYAKANDIAKREKLRKALLDALNSMGAKKKNTMTSLTHDTVGRIQHAAHMLKEFKRMYQLSQDVMTSFKEYNTARKNLVDIGKTKDGAKMLKRYVILRDNLSNNYKRDKIGKPTVIDDTDISKVNSDDRVAKTIISKQDKLTEIEKSTGNGKATPGTLQIIRLRKTDVGNVEDKPRDDENARKRYDFLMDARAAFAKAKAKIKELKAKITEIATARKSKTEAKYGKGTGNDKVSDKAKGSGNETSDHGTKKKSYLTTQADAVKEESLGHINNGMAISGMLKKAEKEDLQAVSSKGYGSAQESSNAVTSLPIENLKGVTSLPVGQTTTSKGSPDVNAVQQSANAATSLPVENPKAVRLLPVGQTINSKESTEATAAQQSATTATKLPVENPKAVSSLPVGETISNQGNPEATAAQQNTNAATAFSRENPKSVSSLPVASQSATISAQGESPQQSGAPLQENNGPKINGVQGSRIVESPTTAAISNKTTTSPTTSLSSVMDSLAQADEKPTAGQPTKNTATAPIQKPIGVIPEIQSNTPAEMATALRNQTANVTPERNTSTAEVQTSKGVGNTTEVAPTEPKQTATQVMLAASQTKEHKAVYTEEQKVSNFEEILQSKSSSGNVNGSVGSEIKHASEGIKSASSEASVQQSVVKTLDRQLETLQRLQDAKRARRKFESAKRELQSKIKNLYDMAVAYEKPDTESEKLHTKAFINPLPTQSEQELHPGVALAGLTDKAVTVVQTPSDDAEHHGFTLGGLDASQGTAQAHIVDLQPKEENNKVEKVYQVGMSEGAAKDDTIAASKGEKDENKALKSLTDAINNDLKQIEQNERRRQKERKQSVDLKKMMQPLLDKFLKRGKQRELENEARVEDASQKSDETESPTEKVPTKKSEATTGAPTENSNSDAIAAKAQDAFKEVEDYLSKALKHVAKEAIAEDSSLSKETGDKVAEVTNEENHASPTAKSKSPDAEDGGKGSEKKPGKEDKVEGKSGKEAENGKETGQKEKDENAKVDDKGEQAKVEEKKKEDDAKEKPELKETDRNEKLRKIVEEAMKEHAKDPKNPHPVNTDLINPTPQIKKEETKNITENVKPVDEKSAEAKTEPTKKVEQPTERAHDTAANNEAISKAEHMEEQVAQLQEKLYSQAPTEAYKSIEQKPLFSQAEEEAPEQQQQPAMYTEPVHHHKHHHHKHYDDYDDDDREGDDEDDDDGNDDDDNQRYYDDNEDDEDDDDYDRKRKKSYMESLSWPRYQNYQRDIVANRQVPGKRPEMMNRGMLSDADYGREELEDSKKSNVPRAGRISEKRRPAKWKNDEVIYTL